MPTSDRLGRLLRRLAALATLAVSLAAPTLPLLNAVGPEGRVAACCRGRGRCCCAQAPLSEGQCLRAACTCRAGGEGSLVEPLRLVAVIVPPPLVAPCARSGPVAEATTLGPRSLGRAPVDPPPRSIPA